jgi:PHD/YefM family antitoxin component YafN of YafNO toxin-antitoxin module
MTTTALLAKIKHQKIGKLPLVILPLAQWQKVEAMLEDYEMLRSLEYRKSIAESRKQIKQGKVRRLNLKTGAFEKVHKP